MPVVHVQWIEGRSEQTRRELVEAITDDVCRIAQVRAEAVHVVVSDVPASHWGFAGKLKSDG